MKRFAKALLRRIARALPLSARRIILDELANNTDCSFKFLGDMAKKSGFSGFVADGDAGIVRGALDDEAALAKYARNGSWSPNERSLFKDLFAERGGTYLDIGANIGLTVIPIAQNPKIQCYAFEPEPNNFRYLSENVAVNCRAGNVRLLNVALFNKEATLPFEISPRHSGDNRLSLSKEHGEMCEHSRTVISVLAKRLDDVEIDIANLSRLKLTFKVPSHLSSTEEEKRCLARTYFQ